MKPTVTHVVKRTGEAVPYDREKVVVAIYKAAASIGGHDRELSERLACELRGQRPDRCLPAPVLVDQKRDAGLLAGGDHRLARRAESARSAPQRRGAPRERAFH